MAPRPKTFGDFVGQQRAVQYVQDLARGAKAKGTVLVPMLFAAPPGMGKTALARATADYLGTAMHYILASRDLRPTDIVAIAVKADHGDVIIVDEAHALSSACVELLYLVIDDQKVPARRDDGALEASRHESVAETSLILATTKPGKVPAPLRSRLQIIEFEPYRLAELKLIAERIAEAERISLTPQAARRLAEAAQGSIRAIAKRIKALMLVAPATTKFTQADIDALLAQEGVDQHGLKPSQRAYLRTIAESDRSACALRKLAIQIGCDEDYVLDDVEPHLMAAGLVEIVSGRGRKLTAKGMTLAGACEVQQPPQAPSNGKLNKEATTA